MYILDIPAFTLRPVTSYGHTDRGVFLTFVPKCLFKNYIGYMMWTFHFLRYSFHVRWDWCHFNEVRDDILLQEARSFEIEKMECIVDFFLRDSLNQVARRVQLNLEFLRKNVKWPIFSLICARLLGNSFYRPVREWV